MEWNQDLCSLSAEEAMSLWTSGVHFQRSRRGAGSSLTLAALTNFDGLPILLSEMTLLHHSASKDHSRALWDVVSYMYFSRYSVHCTRTIPSNGECSHTTPQQPSAPMTNFDIIKQFSWVFPSTDPNCKIRLAENPIMLCFASSLLCSHVPF